MRIGIMGSGWPAFRHAEAFSSIRGAKIVAVADIDEERRKSFSRRFGRAILQFNDFNDMLAKAPLDAVVVALPTGLHYQAVMRSLDAGLNVLCEKPPATSAAEMMRIQKKTEKAKLVYMFSRQQRFLPSVLKSRNLVRQGKLGEVYHAETRWMRCRGIPWGKGAWFVNKEMGGGVLLDLGIHIIDTAWFVMGCPRPVEVTAGLHCAFSHLAPEGVEYTAEDAAVGLLRFENGETLHFTCTFALNTAGSASMSPPSRRVVNPDLRETYVYGSLGGVDALHGRFFTGCRQRGVWVRQLVPLNQPAADQQKPRQDFLAQARDFIQSVRHGREPINSASQAVQLMQMLDAIRESGDKRKAIRLRNL